MSPWRPLICLSLVHVLVDTSAQLVEPLWPGFEASFRLVSVLALSAAFIVQSLPTSLSQAFFGYLRDRQTTPWLLWAGPIAGAVCMSLIGLSPNPWVLGLLLLLGGLGIGAFHPEAAVAAGRALPEHRTRSLSVFMLGGAVGLGLGPTLSGAVVNLWGLTSLVWLSPVMVGLIVGLWHFGRLGDLARRSGEGLQQRSMAEMFEGRGRLAVALFLICSLRLVPNMAMGKVLSFMLARSGESELQIGLYQSLFLVAASTGMFLMAFRFRAGHERSFMIWCPLIGIPMLAVMGMDASPRPLLIMLLVTSGLILWGTTPAMVSYAQQQFPNGAGMASALTMGLAWGLGGLIQAPITSYFRTTDVPQHAFFAFLPCLILSSLGASLLPATLKEQAEETDPIPVPAGRGIEPDPVDL